MRPTSLDGSPIDVRPIQRHELGKVLLRCLPDGGGIETLFKTQETLGMAAWDGDQCVAQLHCYRLVLPHGTIDHWPAWNRPFYLEAVLDGCLGIAGSVWCHACCHVGRSIDSFSRSDEPDRRYFGRGIGTALCQASIHWAREHNYQAVLAPGTPAACSNSRYGPAGCRGRPIRSLVSSMQPSTWAMICPSGLKSTRRLK